MANNQFGGPLLAPDLLKKQHQLQNNQMLAQALMRSETPQGQMVSGHYVAPNVAQQLAAALSPVVGQRIMQKMPEQMADLQQARMAGVQAMFGGDQQSGTQVNGNAQRLGQALGGQPMMPDVFGDPRRNAMAYMQDPGKYWEMAAARAKPVNVAPGGSLYNPQTGQVDYTAPKDGIAVKNGRAVPVGGYRDIAAGNAGAIADAQEGAKAGLDIVKVDRGDGTLVDMTRAQYADFLKDRGAQPAADPQNQSVATIDGGFGTSPSPTSQKAAEGLNSDWITGTYRPTLDNASSANNLIGTITAMRNIPLDTGFGTEAKGMAANLLTSLGVKNAEKLATDVQKFQSLAMDRLQTELMKQKGPQTEGDAQRAGKTFAKLSNTPEANKFIFDFAQAKANMDIRKARFYELALPLARKQGDLTEIDRRWRKVQGSIFDDPLLAPYAQE